MPNFLIGALTSNFKNTYDASVEYITSYQKLS